MYGVCTNNIIDNQPETLSEEDVPPLVHIGCHKVKTIPVVIDLKRNKNKLTKLSFFST